MYIRTSKIIGTANRIVRLCETRDPYKIADELGVIIIPCRFKQQKGVYKVIKRNRFIFIKSDMDEVTESIVLLHELGHDLLHRSAAAQKGAFHEFNIFDMRSSRMEYEANIFAAQVSLPDDEVLEYIGLGYDTEQIARAMCSDINLVALKVDTLISQGYRLRSQEHKNNFLKY